MTRGNEPNRHHSLRDLLYNNHKFGNAVEDSSNWGWTDPSELASSEKNDIDQKLGRFKA